MVNFPSTIFLFLVVLFLERFSYAGENIGDDDPKPTTPRILPALVDKGAVLLIREVFPYNQRPPTKPLRRSYKPGVGIFYAEEVDFYF